MKLLEFMTSDYREKFLTCLNSWKDMNSKGKLWGDFDHFPTLIDHGEHHVQNIYLNVEGFLYPKFIEDQEFLSSRELFYLLSSVYLHDIGCRGVTEDEEWEFRRDNHSKSTVVILATYPSRYLLSPEDAKAVALISAYHPKRAPLTERHLAELKAKGKNLTEDCIKDGESGGEKVRFRLLAAILQICDACDRQKSRFREDKIPSLNDTLSGRVNTLSDIEKLLINLRNTGEQHELIKIEEVEEKLVREIRFLSLQYEKKYMLSIDKCIIDKDRILLSQNYNLKWPEEVHIRNLKSAVKKIEEDLILANEVLKDYGLTVKEVEIMK